MSERIKLNQPQQPPYDGRHHYQQTPPPQPPGHYAPPPAYTPPPEPPKKSYKGLKIFGGIVAGLFVLGAIGNGANDGDTSTSTTAASTLPQSSGGSIPTLQQAEEVESGPDLSQGIPDGQYIVGDEVAVGRYRSAGAQSGIFELCSVATKTANGDVIDWKTGNEGDQVLITVTEKADTIEISGCEPLQRVN